MVRKDLPLITPQEAAFFQAAAHGDIATITAFLEAGMDVNAADRTDCNATPLSKAAARGQVVLEEFLLDQGADIQQTDGMNWPPLTDAAEADQIEAVKVLLERGVDVNFSSALEDRGVPAGTALRIVRHREAMALWLKQAGGHE